MTEQEALNRMIAPGQVRPSKPYLGGVIQIWVTRACDMACYGCTQGSNLGGKPGFITLEQYEQAVISLKGYFGVVGMFGGNPALHPRFRDLCAILKKHVPYQQRGIWSNNPVTLDNARTMREVFNPTYSNLNVHLNARAYSLFRQGWPECKPVGLTTDSRHSPPYVAMKDVIADEEQRWELISRCDINQRWSAMIGVFRDQVRAWFCEVAGAQAMLHQDEPDYPDTGLDATVTHRYTQHGAYDPVLWWQLPMYSFIHQVRKHCHECGVPLRGYGELAQSDSGKEQVSITHQSVYKPKRVGRAVELVTVRSQLNEGKIGCSTNYLQNASL